MTPQLVILTVHLSIAALLAGLGWPLWQRKIRPNWWYGFRTPATLRDERIWYPVNEAAGRGLVWISALFGPTVLTTYLLGLPVAQAALINSVPLVVGLLVMTVYGFVQIHRLKRQLN